MSELTTAEYTEKSEKANLGFWIYLLTDGILFSCFFATYVILRHNVNGGPGTHDLFDLNFVLAETIILLTSSYTVGLANLALKTKRNKEFVGYFIVTILLGIAFLALELHEFGSIIAGGHSWTTSAFLTSFFSLVGLHGAHITVGLIWGSVLGWAIWRQGKNRDLIRKFSLFAMFWHFLDIIWIFIFTVVYVLGVI